MDIKPHFLKLFSFAQATHAVNKDTFPEIVLPIKVETTTVVVVDSTTTTTVVEEVDAHVVSSLQEKPFFLFMIYDLRKTNIF